MILSQTTLYQRRAIIIFYDVLCILASYYFSYVLRYEAFAFDHFASPIFLPILLLNVSIQMLAIWAMGIHRGLWRFASTKDLILIIKAVLIAVTASAIANFFYNRLQYTPRSIHFLDAILLVISLSGGRFFYRMLKQRSKFVHEENAILIGAGIAGEQLVREFSKNPNSINYNISTILDDDKKKHGRTLHGIKISGDISSLSRAKDKFSASIVLIAIPTANNNTIRKIYNLSKSVGLKVNTLPPIVDLLSGKVSFKQMREVQVEDIMGRNMVDLDLDTIAHSHRDKTIFISGAGGSIGSELCRQVLHYKPKNLILIDNSEFNIYKIGEEFLKAKFSTNLHFKTISVYDKASLERVFEKYKPDIVYHAAAYKHVPIMEANPLAAIKTNILGTHTMAELAGKYNVERFILVSTDKAVNPTNVMGVSKRIAEMVCEFHQKNFNTKYSMVRFGNVLGSSGSVIPKFKSQIASGGPITVTHPDITRFFMAIPEAAQLVIQAGCLANGGEIFVLNMGTPVKIVDLAKELIALSGYEVDTEIKIEFTGLRPGEKLYEELLSDSETTLPTANKMVRVAKTRPISDRFIDELNFIFNLEDKISNNEIKTQLHKMVSEYKPDFKSEEQYTRELQ